MQALEAFFTGRSAETPDSDFFEHSATLSAAFEAVLAAHAQQAEAWRSGRAEADASAAAAETKHAQAQVAAGAFAAALRRIVYRAEEPVAMDFLAAMDDAAAAVGDDDKSNAAVISIPGGRDATEALGAFLCDVEADRLVRATLEEQLRAESSRAEDWRNSTEALQVSVEESYVPLCSLA